MFRILVGDKIILFITHIDIFEHGNTECGHDFVLVFVQYFSRKESTINELSSVEMNRTFY